MSVRLCMCTRCVLLSRCCALSLATKSLRDQSWHTLMVTDDSKSTSNRSSCSFSNLIILLASFLAAAESILFYPLNCQSDKQNAGTSLFDVLSPLFLVEKWEGVALECSSCAQETSLLFLH